VKRTASEPADGKLEPHPPGLSVLFGAEACERFSYYGMRALLALYLVNQLRFPRQDALAIFGVYTGLVYLTPLAGGYFADKLLGRRKAVLIGGTLMALGHLAMAFESLLFVALGLLILGNGFFKPNISTIVGGLYTPEDRRRDSAFTIFYMGINLGAFLAPLVCGNLGEHVGWHYGFSAAAVAMFGGLGVFIWGQRWLGDVGLPPRRVPARAQSGAVAPVAPSSRLLGRDYLDVALWVAGGTVLVLLTLALWAYIGPLWAVAGRKPKLALVLALIVVASWWLFRGTSRDERERLLALVVLCLFNIFFWMGFEQAGGTMTLFADKQTARVLGWPEIAVAAVAQIAAGVNVYRTTRKEAAGTALWLAIAIFFVSGGLATLGYGIWSGGRVEFAASQFQAINPLLIVALAPTFSLMWMRLDQGRWRTSTPTKMAIGMIVLGLGFVVMYAGQRLALARGQVAPGWLAAVYAIHTVGELCLSPIGLSMVTKLAPARTVSFAMGVWFGSSAIANYLAGTLEGMLEGLHVPIYAFLIASSIGPGLLLLALTPHLKRWMHGRA
jgi:POT family proton-dependent oligopeptide transporter